MSSYDWHSLFSWTYTGVNNSLAGNGGEECMYFIPAAQKIIETVLFTSLGLLEMRYAYPHLVLPATPPPPAMERTDRTGKRIILAMMCITFGIELGFKFATRQMIWILNPCHLITMIQIYILVAMPSKLVMATYRIHIHLLGGATMALLFPVVNTRLLPFETEVYYLQHILMLVIPIYLMRLGGIYTPEPLSNLYWMLMALGINFVYHFVPLQAIANLCMVNLNSLLCPAISDPFYSQWYRLCAAVHQTALILIHGKAYTCVASLILRRNIHAVVDRCDALSNGYVKKH